MLKCQHCGEESEDVYAGWCKSCAGEKAGTCLGTRYILAHGLTEAFAEAEMPIREFCMEDWTHFVDYLNQLEESYGNHGVRK